jgi:hypothetical protein
MRALFLLAFLFSFLGPIRIVAQTVPMQAQAHAGDVLQAHRSWGEQMNTKGATLRMKEVSRKGNVISAQFYAEGLPKKWIYSLISYPIGSENASVVLTGVTLASDGRAICSGRPGECGKELKDAPVTLYLSPKNGEPLRFGLFAKTDQTVRAVFNYVPFPIAATDKGCKAEAVILEPGAGLVHIEGSGFPAGATVTLNSEASGKSAQKKLRASAKGGATSALMPGRSPEKQAMIRVQMNGPACAPSLSIPWSH